MLSVRQAVLAPLVPMGPPALMLSVMMSPEEAPPTGTAGPAPTLPDMPVTPNVIEAESIPGGSLTRPASENATAPLAAMLLPNPSFPGFPAATAEAEKSPVTQLPDAAVSELVPPPMLVFTNTHEIGPVLAERNPLPPALTPPNAQSVPVGGGPAVANAEKVPARAKGEPSRRQLRHSADRPRNADSSSSATPFSLQNLTGTRATTTPSPRSRQRPIRPA